MNITYLVGNGLDLSFGLKTAYKDFYKYQMELYKPENGESNIIYDEIMLDENNNFENWSDFELKLGKMSIEKPELFDDEMKRKRFIDDYIQVIKDLVVYLKKVEQEFINDPEFEEKKINFLLTLKKLKDDLPGSDRGALVRYFENFGNVMDYVNILTFNYTSVLDKLYNKSQKTFGNPYRSVNQNVFINEPIHAHGTLDKHLILGLSDASQISELFSEEEVGNFIKKTSFEWCRDGQLELNSKIIHDSDLFVIYGMSIGDTDKLLWNKVAAVAVTRNIPVIIYHFIKDLDFTIPQQLGPLYLNITNDFVSKSGLTEEDQSILRGKIYIILGEKKGMFNFEKK